MTKPILIGSRAMEHWFSEYKCKPNTDWDLVGWVLDPWLVEG